MSGGRPAVHDHRPDPRPRRKLAALVFYLHRELARRGDDDGLGSLDLLTSANIESASVDEAARRDMLNLHTSRICIFVKMCRHSNTSTDRVGRFRKIDKFF